MFAQDRPSSSADSDQARNVFSEGPDPWRPVVRLRPDAVRPTPASGRSTGQDCPSPNIERSQIVNGRSHAMAFELYTYKGNEAATNALGEAVNHLGSTSRDIVRKCRNALQRFVESAYSSTATQFSGRIEEDTTSPQFRKVEGLNPSGTASSEPSSFDEHRCDWEMQQLAESAEEHTSDDWVTSDAGQLASVLNQNLRLPGRLRHPKQYKAFEQRVTSWQSAPGDSELRQVLSRLTIQGWQYLDSLATCRGDAALRQAMAQWANVQMTEGVWGSRTPVDPDDLIPSLVKSLDLTPSDRKATNILSACRQYASGLANETLAPSPDELELIERYRREQREWAGRLAEAFGLSVTETHQVTTRPPSAAIPMTRDRNDVQTQKSNSPRSFVSPTGSSGGSRMVPAESEASTVSLDTFQPTTADTDGGRATWKVALGAVAGATAIAGTLYSLYSARRDEK